MILLFINLCFIKELPTCSNMTNYTEIFSEIKIFTFLNVLQILCQGVDNAVRFWCPFYWWVCGVYIAGGMQDHSNLSRYKDASISLINIVFKVMLLRFHTIVLFYSYDIFLDVRS